MMTYQVIPPAAELRLFVRFFWTLESNTLPAIPYVYRSMADGCAEFIFHYQGGFDELTDALPVRQASSMIHAPTRRYRRFVTKERFGIFGVYIYPFAIPHLIGLPSSDTTDQMPDLATVLGRAGYELDERIMLAPNTATRVAILSEFLRKRFAKLPRKDLAVQSAIRHVIHADQLPNVPQLAGQYNLSTRQFERKFREYAGFSPKLFSRIIRFQAALKHYDGVNTKSLTDIAYDCGYYDQSHFILDFKAFSGYNPKQYFGGKAEGSEFRTV